jgi:hypothetical protein
MNAVPARVIDGRRLLDHMYERPRVECPMLGAETRGWYA